MVPMTRQKRILVGVAVVFTAAMVGFAVDIFSRTTRPGAKRHLIESVKSGERLSPPDSLPADSAR